MDTDWLFAWWNAIYTVPLAVALIVAAVTALVGMAGGVLGDSSGEHGGHEHGGHDHGGHDHGEHCVGSDTGDGDAEGDSDAHGGGHDSPIGAVLLFLGVGRAPLTVVLQVLLIAWGLAGVGLHRWAGANGPLALVWSVPTSLVISVVVTRGVAWVFIRVFPREESTVVGKSEIVGRTGSVVFTVTGSEGTVNVRDAGGTLHRLRARTEGGPIAGGEAILVTSYDPATDRYEVERAEIFANA